MAVIQRIRQGVRALSAFARHVDYDLAARYLNDAQMALLRRLNRSERLHSLRVLREVLAQESTTPDDLAVAALLHDCGKARYPLAIWQKSLVVIVRAISRDRYDRWSEGDPQHPLTRGFVVSRHHPAWSGDMALETGVNERAVWLITHHADPLTAWQDHPNQSLLAQLQRADDIN